MTGWGWPRPRLRAPSSCRPPGPRSCQMARYPRTTPRHFDGLSARPGASVSRRSPRNRAHRGHRAGFFGVGRACRPGPASAASRSLQKIVGAIVGAASRAGREHLQGSSPPDIHREGFRAIDTRPRTAWRSTRAARSVSRRRR